MKAVLKNTGIIFYFTILTAIYSYPLILNIKTHIPYGYEGPKDGIFSLWNIHSNIKNLEKGDMLSMEGNIFYPEESVLVLNDRSIFNSIIAYPVYKATGNIVLTFNIIYFLIYILRGYGFFLIAHLISRDIISSLISSTAINYIQFYHYPENLYANSIEWSSFAIYFLFLFFSNGKILYCLLSALFYIFAFLSTLYNGVFLTYTIAWFFLFFLYNYRLYYDINFIKKFLFTYILSGIIILFYILPYLKLLGAIGTAVSTLDRIGGSFNFLSFFPVKKETSYLWWRLTGGILEESQEWESFTGLITTLFILLFFKSRLRGVFLSKSGNKLLFFLDRFFAGILIFLLFLILLDAIRIVDILPQAGIYNTRAIFNYGFLLIFYYFLFSIFLIAEKRQKIIASLNQLSSSQRFFLYLFVVSFILSLGPLGGLYLIFDRFLPGFTGVRAPCRFLMMALFAFGVIIAVSIRDFLKLRMRYLAPFILLFAIIEHMNPPMKLYRIPSYESLPAVYRWLQEKKEETTILEIPLQKPEELYRDIEEKRRYITFQTIYMYYSTFHNKKLVNGYSSFIPIWYKKLCKLMLPFPDALSIFALKELGVNYIIIHKEFLSHEEIDEIEKRLPQYFKPEDIMVMDNDILLIVRK